MSKVSGKAMLFVGVVLFAYFTSAYSLFLNVSWSSTNLLLLATYLLLLPKALIFTVAFTGGIVHYVIELIEKILTRKKQMQREKVKP